MAVTRVVASSAGRTSGTIDRYDAVLPWEIKGVTSVSLVAATIPYPERLLNSGAYVVLRIADMEVTASNDGVLDRCFVALPCVDNIQKILPTTYCPPRPIRKLAKLRISFVDAAGGPVDLGEHILQFDVEHVGHVPLDTPPTHMHHSLSETDPSASQGDPAPAEAADGATDIALLIEEGDRVGAAHGIKGW
jgi:hypothetical protein